MTARSRLTPTGLGVRAVRAYAGGLVLLALVALVTTTALAAWPRAASSLLGGELRYELTQAGAGGRDLTTAVRAGLFSPGAADPQALWERLPAVASGLRAAMPEPLRAVTAPGDSAATSTDLPTQAPAGAAGNSRYSVALEAYQGLREEARLVDGAWPSPVGEPLPAPDLSPVTGLATAPVTVETRVQVVMTVAAARLLDWKVGEVRTTGLGSGVSAPVELAGTVEPVDARSDFWNLDAVRSEGHFADQGDAGKDYGGVGWIAAESWPEVLPALDETAARIWFPVRPSAFTVESLPAVRAALGGFLASPHAARVGSVSVPLAVATSLQGPLDGFVTRAQPANTLFAVLAAGPLVVALTVLALGARLVVGRRRAALELMAARGASPGRLRAGLVLQGLLASLPAAAIGLSLAFLLVPDGVPVAAPVVLAAVGAALPPLALVLAAGSLTPRVGSREEQRPRWAWVAEVVVLGLAALGVVLLARRGLASPGGGLEIDPLVALTPVLVALAACVVVLRVTVFPLRWLAGAFRSGRGAVAFLGASSARDSRTGVLWPVFALVAGVSIALFSVSMLTTSRAGLEEGARLRVGSDLSLTGSPSLTARQLADVKRLPGVAATATVEWAGGLRISAGGAVASVSGYLVDPRQLDAVQASLPEKARLSHILEARIPGRTGAALGGWNSRIPITSALVETGGTNIHLGVTELDFVPGVYVDDGQWVFLDKTALPASSDVTGRPSTVLVALAPGADAAAVHAGLQRIGGAGATIGDAVAERDALRRSPLVAGTETVALLSIGLTALLCVAALLLTLVLNTGARIRLVATLRTIGFSSRQTAGVLAWELGPVLVVGLLAGAVVGLTLPTVVLGPLDLRGFTGSPVQPAIVRDPLLSAAALAGFALVAAAATAVALAAARRRSPAAVLRTGGGE